MPKLFGSIAFFLCLIIVQVNADDERHYGGPIQKDRYFKGYLDSFGKYGTTTNSNNETKDIVGTLSRFMYEVDFNSPLVTFYDISKDFEYTLGDRVLLSLLGDSSSNRKRILQDETNGVIGFSSEFDDVVLDSGCQPTREFCERIIGGFTIYTRTSFNGTDALKEEALQSVEMIMNEEDKYLFGVEESITKITFISRIQGEKNIASGEKNKDVGQKNTDTGDRTSTEEKLYWTIPPTIGVALIICGLAWKHRSNKLKEKEIMLGDISLTVDDSGNVESRSIY